MPRAFLIILDSFGIGGAADAEKYGDAGANTLLHIAERMKLKLPHMASLGLGLAAESASGRNPFRATTLIGRWGHASEVSKGKDTITGHWEIAGVPVLFDWGYFPHKVPAFPRELIEGIVTRCKLPGLLSMAHASGTQVIEEFGEEHIRTGKPIAYTSADSVLQIAAHEEHFGLERLYETCRVARELTYPLKIGRVIARPFLGETAKSFARTGHRKDFAIEPPSPTLLKRLTDAGRDVVSMGKIGDIYAHVGTGREVKVSGNAVMMEKLLQLMPSVKDGGLLMTNFVDFDTNFGHRRDPLGYGSLLEEFDAALPRVSQLLRPGDLLILTADHGNDPTWTGTDHTREQVPIMSFMPGMAPGSIGHRETFADMGQTIAQHLEIDLLGSGKAWPLS